jgi:hypothetical protein
VAYDTRLADRIRERLVDQPDVREQAMFGGLAFLVGGHLAVAASGQGGLLVRVDPTVGSALIAGGKAEPMVMRGRPMAGWLRVSADAVRTARQLDTWVRRGVAHASALPPKAATAKGR